MAESEQMKTFFNGFAQKTAALMGAPGAFIGGVLVTLIWIATGPLFHYSDTWQLVINTGTSVITFLMVFLIQSTQNRDSKAMHLKLDELIRSSQARNALLNLERCSDEEITKLEEEFKRLKERSKTQGATHEAPVNPDPSLQPHE